MKRARKDIPIETLRQLLRYDAETGELFWQKRPITDFPTARTGKIWNTRYSGKPALSSINRKGYNYGTLLGQTHRAHRVIWALVYGEWPKGEIDHINGNPADNSLANLREVTSSGNKKNQKLYASNKSGVVGVYWYKNSGKWLAKLRTNGKDIFLGYHETFEDALVARKAGEAKYGFHPNHGRSA